MCPIFSDCNLRDKMTVRIKVNDSYTATLKVLCGSQTPQPMMSNGPFMQLEFQAQSQNPDARGFNMSFRFVNGELQRSWLLKFNY